MTLKLTKPQMRRLADVIAGFDAATSGNDINICFRLVRKGLLVQISRKVYLYGERYAFRITAAGRAAVESAVFAAVDACGGDQ